MNRSDLEQDTLPYSVGLALGALKPVPAPDTETWQEGRLAFIRTAAALAEARPLAAAPTVLAPRADVARGLRRVPAFFGGLLSITRRRVAPMRAALILVALALLVGASAGTVSAARASLPGSPLYALKVRLEQWDLRQARTPQDISRQALVQSQKRVEEAARLMEAGEDVPHEVAVRFREQLSLAMQASGSLEEPQRLQAQSDISETLQYQIRTMAEVAAKVKGDDAEAVDNEAVTAMVRAMVETQAQLGAGYGQDSGAQLGEPAQAGPGSGCSGQGCEGEQEQPGGAGSGSGSEGDEGSDDHDNGGPGTDPKQGDGNDNSPGNRIGPGDKDSGPDSSIQNDDDQQLAAHQVGSTAATIASASLANPPALFGAMNTGVRTASTSSQTGSSPAR